MKAIMIQFLVFKVFCDKKSMQGNKMWLSKKIKTYLY